MLKALVICYSLEGHTLTIAQTLKKELNIDLLEIKPAKEIKSIGFSKYIIGGGQVMFKKKPTLASIDVDLSLYDTIILGSPIWAGTFTPPIRTLLEKGILKDKNIAFFYTHQGGANKAELKAKKSILKYNKFISALSLRDVGKQTDVCKQQAVSWGKNILNT